MDLQPLPSILGAPKDKHLLFYCYFCLFYFSCTKHFVTITQESEVLKDHILEEITKKRKLSASCRWSSSIVCPPASGVLEAVQMQILMSKAIYKALSPRRTGSLKVFDGSFCVKSKHPGQLMKASPALLCLTRWILVAAN